MPSAQMFKAFYAAQISKACLQTVYASRNKKLMYYGLTDYAHFLLLSWTMKESQP